MAVEIARRFRRRLGWAVAVVAAAGLLGTPLALAVRKARIAATRSSDL